MYKMVMFKVPTKIKGARVPDVPTEAFNNCHCAWTDCSGEYSYTFAIIEDKVDTEKMAVELKVIPLSKEEEEKYINIITNALLECDYLNGVKERPVLDLKAVE